MEKNISNLSEVKVFKDGDILYAADLNNLLNKCEVVLGSATEVIENAKDDIRNEADNIIESFPEDYTELNKTIDDLTKKFGNPFKEESDLITFHTLDREPLDICTVIKP